jgi:1,2-diacylglycerol-3-alpha-glucose alpha-1,2-galactosyltransferase
MNKIRINIVSESDVSVQGHGVHTAYDEMASALEKRQDVTVIRGDFDHLTDCDVVHLHTIGFRILPKLFQRGPKKVVSAHVVPDSFVGSLMLAKYWKFIIAWYMRRFYNRADLLLAVSEDTRQDLVAMGVKSPIEVLHNFIDSEKYTHSAINRKDIRAQLGIPDDAFMVIGAGQVQPRKRVDSLIEAAAALPDVHFVWLGGMPFGVVAADAAQMKKMMAVKTDNMHFPGIISHQDMVSYYRAADLFWLPSDQETFGLVIVEAAAAGLPILLRQIPDYDETFGQDACYASDHDGFVQQITHLQQDKKAYAYWKTKAKVVADRYDSKAAAARLVAIYRRLLEN